MNKKYILKKNYEIEKLVKKRNSVGDQYYAIYYNETINKMPKIAISISKHIGNAVVRNYEKRVHREIIRAMMCDLEHLEILFVIKQKSLMLSTQEKNEKIKRLVEIINKKRRLKWKKRKLYH